MLSLTVAALGALALSSPARSESYPTHYSHDRALSGRRHIRCAGSRAREEDGR
jgi:hypothetical protein